MDEKDNKIKELEERINKLERENCILQLVINNGFDKNPKKEEEEEPDDVIKIEFEDNWEYEDFMEDFEDEFGVEMPYDLWDEIKDEFNNSDNRDVRHWKEGIYQEMMDICIYIRNALKERYRSRIGQ